MQKYNISANPVCTIEQLYVKPTCALQMNGSMGECFRTTVRVRQGCLLSPTLFNFFVPRGKSKGTIVMGSSVHPSVRPSTHRHYLVSATRPTVFKGFWWNFPVIVSMTWRCAYFIEVTLNWFLPELWPFNNFSAVSLVSATPLTVFKGFWWNFPVIVSKTWRCAYYTEVTLDRFLPELWPFVSFSHFINRSSCLHNSSYSFQGIFMKLSRYGCHDLKMHIFYQGHARLIFTRVMAL